MEKAPCRCWVEISTRRIAENFAAVREVVGPAVEVMPVVKADAYHHGAVEVSRVLVGEGARWLAVSNLEEGVELRDAGIGVRILVMAGLLGGEWETAVARDLTPVIHSLDELALLERIALRTGRRLAWHLKIDTGLGRLGTRASSGEILSAIHGAPHTELEGLMTHLASASDFKGPQTKQQLIAFESMFKILAGHGCQPCYLHTASSSAIAYGRRGSWKTMVRPGLSIYGYVSPAEGDPPERLLAVRPALTWKAAVLDVKDLPQGATIGYGALFRAPRPMRIAVLGAGYADGYPHQLGNRSRVILKGRHAALLGAVSMDLLTVDATGCPDLQPGDAATLLGREGEVAVDATELALGAGTITYAVLCGIAARVKKVHV
ncbi:MAG: alanine racemase [Acidobacteria bacterium]|nr:alanine racemase [Acidobacteriota bacterium]